MLDYKDLIDRADGYTVGTLVITNGQAILRTDKGAMVDLDKEFSIEVYNGDHYEKVDYQEIVSEKTFDGVPLFAGLYCRVKEGVKKNEPRY